MKKLLIVLILTLTLTGCGAKDEMALGKYKDRNYVNENFKMDFTIPEGFSHLTADELKSLNDGSTAQSEFPERAKYRNLILNVQHLDGTKMMAFVDSEPSVLKDTVAEANAYLDFLNSQDIQFKSSRSNITVNGIDYLQLDLELPFNQRQRNYIAAQKGKLVNVQINYDVANVETAKLLLDLYE